MEQKEGSWVRTIIIAVPLTVAITLAVLMAYVKLTKWMGEVRVSFSWQSEEMAELKDKLQSSFDALIDGLEIFGKKLAKVIEEYLDLIGRLFTDYEKKPENNGLKGGGSIEVSLLLI